MSNTKNQIDLYVSLLPLKKSERTLGLWDLLVIQFCFGISVWFFLIGAQTGTLLSAREAIPTVLFGNCIPLFLISFIGIASARYGVEQLTLSSGIFGQKGSGLVLIFYILICYASLAFANLMFGHNATKFIEQLHGPKFLISETTGVVAFAVFALIIGGYFAFRGPKAVSWLSRISVAFMILVLAGLIIYILHYYGLSNVWNAKPSKPYFFEGNPLLGVEWSRATALEVNVGLGLSWGFFFGQWTRLAKSEGAGYHGCMWGWGVLAAFAGIVAALVALALGVYDPTLWIVKIGSSLGIPAFSIFGLLFMAVANIGAASTLIYSVAISLRSSFPKMRWISSVLIGTIPTLFLLFPDVYYMINKIYSVVGLLAGVYSAIVVSDFLFISKGRFRLRELFSANTGYQFAKGWNPAALISIAVGFVTYFVILNPLTWKSPSGLFPHISASLPTFFVTAILYVILMKAWIMKKYRISFVNDTEFGVGQR